MKYEIPSERMAIPQSKIEVEYRTKRDLERAIEALLDDKEITDGLDDESADLILVWATSQIERAYEEADLFSEAASAIRDHARFVGDIATMIANDVGRVAIVARLRQRFPVLPTDDFFSDVEEAILIMLVQFESEEYG